MKQTLLILGGMYLAAGLPVAAVGFTVVGAAQFSWWLTIFAWVAWPYVLMRFIITGCFVVGS